MELESEVTRSDKPVVKKSSKNPFEVAIVNIWKRDRSAAEVIIHIFNAIALMIVGHLLFNFLTVKNITTAFSSVTSDILYYLLGGFIAQMIDGALGMAYGVTATTFLLSVGITPAAASASVHASEVFTSGVSGYMHLKFGNVNSKLFKTLLIPGIIGAVLGAYIISSLEEYASMLKPIISTYTLILGIIIIKKALKKRQEKRTLKKVGWLAMFGGYMDAIGGGGWGPIVSSTLIASGRHPRYTIGSVNLAEFFISLASSITFVTVIGLGYWQVIAGLILGGMVAAPIAARLSSKLPVKTMMILVGMVVIIVSLRQIVMAAIKYL
ncbi:hypothetical protein SAMN04515674_102318 [Pseudarcicella hirudinis]|uniref:Probable membrane transporter protein n=3 Tax=Pseudarcicella hirudinis TaxID=1079859 RepID=A0A1I5P6X7_9BACT|nr:sulfite exporter TauE/SafE family protein [Pseudarcicella hirudinis]SFP29842.1 hypothetical protein SAMN04515674_102318 [Pseudarcicella hirudinis]